MPENRDLFEIDFVDVKLCDATAPLAQGAQALCLFVTDRVSAYVLNMLHKYGVRLLAMRYPGHGRVDVSRAAELGISVTRIPEHSAGSVAEYAVTLMLMLARKVPEATERLRNDIVSRRGLLGLELSSSTIGVLGTGLVGRRVVQIMRAFGSRVLAYDSKHQQSVVDMGAEYVPLADLLVQSDVLTIHAPLLPSTLHIIGKSALSRCKPGVLIVNTSRGALVHNGAIIAALESGAVGAYALDAFQGEAAVFFQDNADGEPDKQFQRLQAMPNVFISGHQAEMTNNAVEHMAKATIQSLCQFSTGKKLEFQVQPKLATDD